MQKTPGKVRVQEGGKLQIINYDIGSILCPQPSVSIRIICGILITNATQPQSRESFPIGPGAG